MHPYTAGRLAHLPRPVWAILAAAAVAVGLFAAVVLPAFAPPPGKPADFCLFTTEDTGASADESVTFSNDGRFELHVSVTNLEATTQTLRIIFADGDLVDYFVPAGESFSLSQVAGTAVGVDDTIIIDPLDQDGDATPMIGWTSALKVTGSTLTCTVQVFNPIA
jgi:hypothetical protein